MESWSNRLKLGKHYHMERFSFMFIALVACLAVIICYSWVMHSNAQGKVLATRSVYTTSVVMSKTQQTAKVAGVYSSEDKKKALVLLKFDDVSKISTDASKYQMFLTSAAVVGNPVDIPGKPVGGFYVFGSSGYVGVYLINESGFKPQVLDLVVRSNVELAKGSSSSDDEISDASFNKYDQGQLFFNPGGTDVKILKALSTGKAPSVKDIYDEAVLTKNMDAIHAQLDDKLEAMRVDLNVINEYTDRLDRADGVQVPDQPRQIAGDTIEVVGKKDKVEQQAEKKVSEDGGEGSTPSSVDKLMLKTNFVVPGGYDFDWRDTDGQSWLKRLIKKTDNASMTSDQFFAMKNAEMQTNTADSTFDTKRVWTLKDGTKVDSLNTGTNTGKYAQINKDIQQLIMAWQQYYTDKTVYQRSLLGKVLEEEAQADLIDSSSSINVADNVLTVY